MRAEKVQSHFVSFDSVSSTQDEAKHWLAEHLLSFNECYWVRARHQSAGRGRQGRSWENAAPPNSPDPGSLLVSCAFHLPTSGQDGSVLQKPLVTLIAGRALYAAVRLCGVHDPRLFLKWPNDLVYEHPSATQNESEPLSSYRKLAGILAETYGSSGVVVGFGVNVTRSPDLAIAGSLSELAPPELDLNGAQLLENLRAEFESFLVEWIRAPKSFEAAFVAELQSGPMKLLWGREGVWSQACRARALALEPQSGALRILVLDGPFQGAERIVSSGEFVFDRSSS